MEKEKKKIYESIPKAIVYTFLIYFLAIAELGILSGFRFDIVTPGGKNGAAIGLMGSTKGYELARIGAEVGWQFVVMSVLLFCGAIGYCFWMGFHRQIWGAVTVVVVNLLPMVGLVNTTEPNGLYSFFWGYGTSGVLPFMSLFGLHMPSDPNNRIGQIIFMIVFAILCAAGWFVGKAYRKSYARKYEFDLSVPLA
ncbi:MAG: hypothetical protein LBT88_08335 [Oscillospiraceae bacterium]|jgi:hypothetical protein|nr:hypothetical protein [Oscillospiraceae bacterium]